MAFKEGEKKPLMAKAPDNTGAFQDIFQFAAKSIGCELEIKRYSKRRVHKLLSLGAVDFYPGASYSDKRAEYLHYSPLGMMTAEYGLSPLHIPEIFSYQQVKDLQLIWLMELGSSKREIADRLKIKVEQTQNLTIYKLRRYFTTRNVNFFVFDKELIDMFLLGKPESYLAEIGLKLHKNCCGGDLPMYLGIAKKSKHFAVQANVSGTVNSLLARQTPQLLAGSTFQRLVSALKTMQETGITQAIYLKHLKQLRYSLSLPPGVHSH
ncbi:MAG: hypothetical protein OFPII_22130 [Osedax symbiont Rs1]|nr:MAG: hypothetical protein OFPII_22130 [Osedax symbiont Rs1]